MACYVNNDKGIWMERDAESENLAALAVTGTND